MRRRSGEMPDVVVFMALLRYRCEADRLTPKHTKQSLRTQSSTALGSKQPYRESGFILSGRFATSANDCFPIPKSLIGLTRTQTPGRAIRQAVLAIEPLAWLRFVSRPESGVFPSVMPLEFEKSTARRCAPLSGLAGKGAVIASGRSVLLSATRVCLSALQKEERVGRPPPARVCLSRRDGTSRIACQDVRPGLRPTITAEAGEEASVPGDRHLLEQDRARADAAAHVEVAARPRRCRGTCP